MNNLMLAKTGGAGMMLLREDHALQGEQEGYLATSPIARVETALSIAHQSGRKDDPLIQHSSRRPRSLGPK